MRIALDLPPDLPPVLGDADELAQVFQNLIDNAIKYGARDTAVEVAAFAARARLLPGGRGGQRNAAVAVAVRDHGEGIAREQLPRLTERFYRVDPARSRELGGTGLGPRHRQAHRQPPPRRPRHRERTGPRLGLHGPSPDRDGAVIKPQRSAGTP